MNELDTLLVSVRADTTAFTRDVGVMRGQLEGPLANGVDAAGRTIEKALGRAITTGSIGFEDLRKVAVAALAEIAASAVKADLGALFGSGSGGGGMGVGGGGLAGTLAGIASALFGGTPGRATGGPVTGGRPYLVGERGPELFVPPGGGSIEAGASRARGPVSIIVNVATPANADTAFMNRTGTQVARAVREALDRADAA